MRPHYSINQTVEGDTLLRRSRTGQLELWHTSGDKYGIYLWVVRQDRPDDKICSFRAQLGPAEELFNAIAYQLAI